MIESYNKTTNRPDFTVRLTEIVRSYGGVSGLARKIGVVEGTIRKWQAGISEPTRDRLVALAEAVGCNVQWLATGEGPPYKGAGSPLRGAVHEGVIDLAPFFRREDKPGTEPQETPGAPHVEVILSVRSKAFLIQRLEVNLEQLSIRFVRGDSMTPTLSDGDAVLIDGGDSAVAAQGIYGFMLDRKEPPLICRLQRVPGGLIKGHYDNPAYRSFEFRPEDNVEILGRVIWTGRKI